jgi:hypothetical protein
MTPEEKRAYNKQYRQEGYGANADARYRERWREKVRAANRERMRNKRRRDGGTTRKGFSL